MYLTESDIDIKDEYVLIKLKDRYGELKGYGYIDIDDIEIIMNQNINLMNNGYVTIRKDNTNIGIHRIITDAKIFEKGDHINGIRSDNRKSNLRVLDNSKNGMNRSKHKNNHSGHRGVYWNDKIPTPKWMAYITIDWKRKHLGYFENLEDAIKARLDAEEKYYSGFAPSEERYDLNIYNRTESKYKTK